MRNNSDFGTLSMRLRKDECLIIETNQGVIKIVIRDSEKRPIVSRVVVKAPKEMKIDSALNTDFAIQKLN